MNDDFQLPPLPDGGLGNKPRYSEQDMRSYALSCIAAYKEQRQQPVAEVCTCPNPDSNYADGRIIWLRSELPDGTQLFLHPADDQRDAERLDFLESNTAHELAFGMRDEDFPQWSVWLMHGYPNDREWDLLGKGDTVRAAIDAAMQKDSK